jgi:ribosomal silencing factor RsfS
MPRTRIKPNTTFVGSKLTIPASTQQQLSSEQRGRLKRIAGLPPAVLPEVETIAAYFLALARRPPPSDAQVRARLHRLQARIENLRKELREIDGYDAYTLFLISSNYAKIILKQPEARHFQNLLRITDIDLQPLAEAVALTDALIIHVPSKGAESSAVADKVRETFQKFGVPFSTAKDSPAISTVLEILRMFRPATKETAARQAVWRAIQQPSRRTQRRAKTGAITEGDKKNVLPVIGI